MTEKEIFFGLSVRRTLPINSQVLIQFAMITRKNLMRDKQVRKVMHKFSWSDRRKYKSGYYVNRATV